MPRFHPGRLGAIVPLIGGIVFVASYSPALGPAWPLPLTIAAVVLVAVALWFLLVRPVDLGRFERPHRFGSLAYLAGVLAMIGAIALGRSLAADAGAEHLVPAIIAACVGLHFLPLAWAFGTRMVVGLGIVVGAVGILGVVVGMLAGPHWASGFAVAAGFVQIVVVLLWAAGRLLPNRRD